jgi:hypothetical protein
LVEVRYIVNVERKFCGILPDDEEGVAIDVPGLEGVLWILEHNLNECTEVASNH